MIKVSNITKYFDEQRVLNNVSFTLEKGHKVALVGFNGTGKTTLLKMLTGEVSIEKGGIEINKKTTISSLPQDPEIYFGKKVLEFLEESAKEKFDNPQIFYRDIEVMFSGFGLPSEVKDKNIGELSSGQKTKVFLIGILLQKTDVMLLDEPTNNLDLPALIWLEKYLQETKSAFIVVSHDKTFLDNVANKIFEIDWKTRRLEVINGKYSDFIERKQKDIDRTNKEAEMQVQELKRLRKLVRTKRDDAAKGAKYIAPDNDHILQGYRRGKSSDSLRDARVFQNRIDRMEKIEKPDERKDFNIKIDPEDSGSPRDILIKDLVCGYDDGFRVGPINLDVVFGSRIFILGLNGTGKSTILKTITGIIPKISGQLMVGNGVKFGNLMQEHESLNKDETVLEYLSSRISEEREILQNHLKHFGFEATQVVKKISTLSPGGRARLLLSYFSATNVNTLILDEPTNHLDIEAEEALEKTLAKFDGTVIVVTHNRDFVEKVSNDSIYVLSEGKLDRIKKFKKYLAEMEEKSKKLLRMLK
jgi:ATP-binding cassette subfamily F protein 3